jgi:hypothetical protein
VTGCSLYRGGINYLCADMIGGICRVEPWKNAISFVTGILCWPSCFLDPYVRNGY